MQEFQASSTTRKSRTYDFTKIRVRSELDATALRKLAANEKDRRIAKRILAIANCMEERKRRETAQWADVSRRALQVWINSFNKNGLGGLRMKKRPGRCPKLAPEGIAELTSLLMRDPAPETHRTAAAQFEDLCRFVKQRFGVSYGVGGMRRLVLSLGFHWQDGRFMRPHA